MARHHSIDYIEITVDDPTRAKDFYGSVFGWKFNDYGPDYVGIQDEDREAGGFSPGDPKEKGPLVILYSDDLDATYEAVKAQGGTITTEPFDFPGGRRFHFQDPAGNDLAVFTETE